MIFFKVKTYFGQFFKLNKMVQTFPVYLDVFWAKILVAMANRY